MVAKCSFHVFFSARMVFFSLYFAVVPKSGSLPGRQGCKFCLQRKRKPNPNLLVIFGRGGGLPREGVGAKKFGMSFEAQGIKKTRHFRFLLLKSVVLDWFMLCSYLFRWSFPCQNLAVNARNHPKTRRNKSGVLETPVILMPDRNRGRPNFVRDIPGLLPEKCEKKKFVFNSRPLIESLHSGIRSFSHHLWEVRHYFKISRSFVRRGCSQSEFLVTNFFTCSGECGEVFTDKFKANFPEEKLAEHLPPKIHHIFQSPPQKKNSNFHHLALLGTRLGSLSCNVLVIRTTRPLERYYRRLQLDYFHS